MIKMLDEAMEIVQKYVGIETTQEDWGFESVTAEREELDQNIIKASNYSLPTLVMTHLFLYVEPGTGKDYVVFFVTDTSSSNEFTRGLLIEGKLFWSGVFGMKGWTKIAIKIVEVIVIVITERKTR